MKRLYYGLIALLCIPAHIYCMGNHQKFAGLADQLSGSHAAAPQGIVMQRASTNLFGQMEETQSSLLNHVTTVGSDVCPQEASVDATVAQGLLEVQETLKTIEDMVIEQKTHTFPINRIIKIFKASQEKQTKILGEQPLSAIISPETKEELQQYYSAKETTIEELADIYLSLKMKAAKIPLTEKWQSTEYEHKQLIYQAMKKKCGRTKTKELLYGAADYDTDEESILCTDSPLNHGTIYRHSKQKLTYPLATLAVSIASNQKIVDDRTAQIAALQEQLKAAQDALSKDISAKRKLSQAQSILMQEREAERKFLTEQKDALTASIEKQKKSLETTQSCIEGTAVRPSSSITVSDLKRQKKEDEEKLANDKKDLEKLEKNLNNFDSPTKRYGVW